MRVKQAKKTQYETERFHVLICPVCGKEFVPAPMHVYKMPTKEGRRVCTYSCALKAEREYEANRKTGGAAHKKRR